MGISRPMLLYLLLPKANYADWKPIRWPLLGLSKWKASLSDGQWLDWVYNGQDGRRMSSVSHWITTFPACNMSLLSSVRKSIPTFHPLIPDSWSLKGITNKPWLPLQNQLEDCKLDVNCVQCSYQQSNIYWPFHLSIIKLFTTGAQTLASSIVILYPDRNNLD